MPIKMNLSGLKRLEQNLKQLDGTHQVPFSEIMSPSFISSNSKFANFDEFARGAGYKVETAEDLRAIPDEPWDAYVRSETPFESWAEMLKAGIVAHAKRSLQKGL